MRRLCILAGLMLFAPAAFADTIEMRDGTILQGNYAGGSQNSVRFVVGGKTQVIPKGNILAITFDEAAPAPAAASAAAASGATVPAGTTVHVKITKGISTRRAGPGLPFEGVLDTGLQVGNRVFVAAGARVFGETTQATKGGGVFKKAQLGIVLTAVMVGDVRVKLTSKEARFVGQAQGTVAKVGMSTAIGAAFGGRKGARRGAAVGGALALASSGKQINIPPGTLLDFDVAAPFQLP